MYTQSSLKTKKKGKVRDRRKILATIGILIGVLGTFFFPAKDIDGSARASLLPFSHRAPMELGAFNIVVPTYKFGFVMDTFQVKKGEVVSGLTMGKLLSENGVSVNDIDRLVANSKGIFNLNSGFRIGKPYTILSDQNSSQAKHLIFEPNMYEYIVFDLTDEMEVRKEEKPIDTKRMAVHGVIESSLWATLTKNGVSFEAAAKMEDALQWSVDFSHTQKGDAFRMIYDQHFIEGNEVGAGQVYAAVYTREGNDSYAFWFEDGDNKGFFDQEGRPIQSSFLKAPVKFTRISSRYNKRRFHPILKRVRPHLGTDYAAPYGTPIYAVGNGVIAEAAYTKGNGRYIKIKHDDVYQTQYLHMSKFAKGMKRGRQVAQGEVVGYVGSSGLATGPHVCFRFWKNGRQVNHLRENLPQAKPLPEESLQKFFEIRDERMAELEAIETGNENAELARNSQEKPPLSETSP